MISHEPAHALGVDDAGAHLVPLIPIENLISGCSHRRASCSSNLDEGFFMPGLYEEHLVDKRIATASPCLRLARTFSAMRVKTLRFVRFPRAWSTKEQSIMWMRTASASSPSSVLECLAVYFTLTASRTVDNTSWLRCHVFSSALALERVAK